jgi:hypothetical protein
MILCLLIVFVNLEAYEFGNLIFNLILKQSYLQGYEVL